MVSKLTKKTIADICLRTCFMEQEKVIKRDEWIFAWIFGRFHLLQDFLKTKLICCFILSEEWSPSSPDANTRDYFYWGFNETKFYEGRFGKLFASETELKKKIKSVWNICADDLVPIKKAIKQFILQIKAIEDKQGMSIKMLFG